MKKIIFFFSVFCTCFFSCQKEDNLLTDRNYPTTIKILDKTALNQKKQAFLSQNQFMTSSLNEFGFCGYSDLITNYLRPPLTAPLTEPQAIEKVKKFITKNKEYLGIAEPDEISISRTWLSTGSYDGEAMWRIDTNYQKQDTIQVLLTDLLILINNSEVTSCTGNWYPNIYVPQQFNFGQEKAKSTLRNKTVWHSDISGQSHPAKITDQALASCQINGLKIYPIKSDDKIQLFVTWKIYVPDVFYILYVDVMTGETIAAEPTIIS
jgi:hypothetical protein